MNNERFALPDNPNSKVRNVKNISQKLDNLNNEFEKTRNNLRDIILQSTNLAIAVTVESNLDNKVDHEINELADKLWLVAKKFTKTTVEMGMLHRELVNKTPAIYTESEKIQICMED